MNTSSDAAEKVISLYLEFLGTGVKISGSGAKNIAAMLMAFAKEEHKVKGKTRLATLLRSGKPLKVFSVKREDLKKFTEEAKKYGVLFHAVVDKKNKNPNSMVDIMVKEEDAAKINRIVDKLKLATVDTATIRTEIEKDKDKNKGVEEKSPEQKLVDEILTKPAKQEKDLDTNPNIAKTVKSPLSEPTLKNKKVSEQGSDFDKPSVKEEIKKIKEEQKEQSEAVDSEKEEIKQHKKTKVTKHKQPKTKKRKSKERGK